MTGSDAELVARCRGGDPSAWNELVERFSRYVFAITTQGFRLAEHDAEDVFQDVFTRVYTHLDRLRDDEAFRPWLAQLTRRACIDKLRAQGREEPLDELEPSGLDETLSALEAALTMHETMATLTDNCRDILDRFFAQDESYRTIGEALGLPAGTVASRISRCLDKLKALLEERDAVARPEDG
ncbi:MAG: sigma-70 family RNA polymerase sigma factor [Actinomycetota bacterium]|nr:sigma-70 family RNA polymerase sigma factor [Actinomycetota bacterium]